MVGPFFLTAHSVMSFRSTKYSLAAAAAALGFLLPAANLIIYILMDPKDQTIDFIEQLLMR